MKLTLKTLSRETFDVEIDENLKVSDLKKKVEEVKGATYPAQNLKLIYAGNLGEHLNVNYKLCVVESVVSYSSTSLRRTKQTEITGNLTIARLKRRQIVSI